MNNTSNPHPLTKYRPSLTAHQLRIIVELCRSEGLDESPECNEIVKIIVPLLSKIEVGAINPAYKLSETHAIKRFESGQRIAYESGTMTPEEEAEYEKNILGM